MTTEDEFERLYAGITIIDKAKRILVGKGFCMDCSAIRFKFNLTDKLIIYCHNDPNRIFPSNLYCDKWQKTQ